MLAQAQEKTDTDGELMVGRLALRDKPATGLPAASLKEVSAHSHCIGRKCPQKNIRINNCEVREFFQLSRGNKKTGLGHHREERQQRAGARAF